MDRSCTPEMVIDILAKKVGVPADTPDILTATWEELGVESLGLSEMFASLSLLLGIEVPHEDALNTSNVQSLVVLVNAQLVNVHH